MFQQKKKLYVIKMLLGIMFLCIVAAAGDSPKIENKYDMQYLDISTFSIVLAHIVSEI